MKKIEQETPNGIITYYQDEKGNISTVKPVENVAFKKWVVTDDPSQYALGTVFEDEQSALDHITKYGDFKDLYCVELSYIHQDLPPQFIHVIDPSGKRIRIL